MFKPKITLLFQSFRRFGSTMSFKLCANLSFMYQEHSSLLDRYAAAKKSGFKAVECAYPYEYPVSEVQIAKERACVDQVLINSFPGNVEAGEQGFACIPGKRKEFRESISTTVTYAKALNCERIHVLSGKVESPTSEHDQVYMSNISYAADIFEQENLIGLLEPINIDIVPNIYLNSFEKAVEVIEEIDSPHLKLQLDIFHLQMLEGNLTKNLKWLLPYTAHIQVAQVPDRHEPDTCGEINYAYVFNLLRELKYSDYVGLEYKPAKSTNEGLKWIENKRFGFQPL